MPDILSSYNHCKGIRLDKKKVTENFEIKTLGREKKIVNLKQGLLHEINKELSLIYMN